MQSRDVMCVCPQQHLSFGEVEGEGEHGGDVQGIADGSLAEAAPENGEAAFAWEGGPAAAAIHRATALMLDESRVSESLALQYLPWLLASLPEQSLAVLKVLCSRPLPVLSLLCPKSLLPDAVCAGGNCLFWATN